MGFLRRLFGGDAATETGSTTGRGEEVIGRDAAGRLTADGAGFDAWADRPRVTVWLRLVDRDFESPREQQRVFALEDRVMRALDAAGVGEHDTNSIEPGYFVMRLVGDDASAIAEVVTPLLEEAIPGSYLALRRGPAGSGEERVDVGQLLSSAPTGEAATSPADSAGHGAGDGA